MDDTDELIRIDGLGKVGVGSRLDDSDAIAQGGKSCGYNLRGVGHRFRREKKHVDPVHVGKNETYQGAVVVAAFNLSFSFFAVLCYVDSEAFFSENLLENSRR